MAQVVINEISQTYNFNASTGNFATVALPITACWGPGFVDPQTVDHNLDEVLEDTRWLHFSATQAGLEQFVATYRGASSNYRITKDYSYQLAMTLLVEGYDILTCRLSPGTVAQGTFTTKTFSGTSAPENVIPAGKLFGIRAKYPGTFGNTLQITLKHPSNQSYWNAIVYTVDPNTRIRVPVENLRFVFNEEHSCDAVPYIKDLESKFLTFVTDIEFTLPADATSGATAYYNSENVEFTTDTISLTSGKDGITSDTPLVDAVGLAKTRYNVPNDIEDTELMQYKYVYDLKLLSEAPDSASATASDTIVAPNATKQSAILYREWLFTYAISIYDLLKDKFAYSPNRLISPGWDDQDFNYLEMEPPEFWDNISPIHLKLMDVAYYSRCATAYLDIPISMQRNAVWNDDLSNSNYSNHLGYTQMLSDATTYSNATDANAVLYNTHSALFAPWGQYQYIGTNKQSTASPSFLALLLQRAMILNQSLQYEWALPTSRTHNLHLGKLQYNVPKKLLDKWQSLEGVSLNVITPVPDLGTNLWGNSTLFTVPPASYQALANLSTRLLVNAIEDVVFKVGVSITFTYNNDEAYGTFYAGVTPILDTMRNVGAIEDYLVKMSADINGLDHINANTVVGKIWITVNGVVNDIIVDLICLPPDANLNTLR